MFPLRCLARQQFPALMLCIGVGLANAAPTIGSAQTATAAAVDPADVRLKHTSAIFSLEDLRAAPWHLKVEVLLAGTAGANASTGTVDVWQSGKDVRTEFVFGDAREVTLMSAGVLYQSSAEPKVPYLAHEVLKAVLRPGPDQATLANATLEARRETLNHQPLDCVVVSPPASKLVYPPLGLFPTYCLLRDKSELGIVLDLGTQDLLLVRVGTFLARRVPLLVELGRGDKIVARGRVSALSTFSPTADTFSPGDMKAANAVTPTHGIDGFVDPKVLKIVPPDFPSTVRPERRSGLVELRVLVGSDGRVYASHVVSAPNAEMALVAMDDVRHWSFQPASFYGKPIDAECKVTVNFDVH